MTILFVKITRYLVVYFLFIFFLLHLFLGEYDALSHQSCLKFKEWQIKDRYICQIQIEKAELLHIY